jgi:hypothetical protein
MRAIDAYQRSPPNTRRKEEFQMSKIEELGRAYSDAFYRVEGYPWTKEQRELVFTLLHAALEVANLEGRLEVLAENGLEEEEQAA